VGRSRQPRLPLPDDGALITRTLWSDSEALRTAESWVRRRIYGLEKEQARALYELYLKSYREVAGTLTMAYGDDGKPVFARRAILLEQMEREINALIAQAEAHIDTALIDAYEQGYAGRAWVLDQATNPNIPIRFRPVLPAQAIRSLLLQPMMGRDRRYMGQDWHTELGFAREEFVLRTKRSLTASMVKGEGIGAAMRRLRDEYGIQTDRRKGFTRNFYQTTMIARTEILRASNLGALAVYEENADILSGWEWTATKDERTCPICGAMDGKRFKFNDPQLQPPSGSHPGCRCTIVPVLKDERLMDEVAGVRETYSEWSARNGMITDGGLDEQRGAAFTGTAAAKPVPVDKLAQMAAENQASLDLARGITPAVIEAGAAKSAIADYMANMFAYDEDANPIFDRAKVDEARLDMLYSVYRLGKGTVPGHIVGDVRVKAAGILAADEWLGKTVLTRAERNRLMGLASPDDETVYTMIDKIRDQRLKGHLAYAREAFENRGRSYDSFVSAAEEDGARRLREARLPWYLAEEMAER